MLTKGDLNQIGKIVQTETTKIVKKEVLASETRLNKKLSKIENKLDYAINFLDRENIKLVHRIERIEDHLGLEPTSI